MNSFAYTDLQKRIIVSVKWHLQQYGGCLLHGDMRTGKTLVALSFWERYYHVFFFTRKEAIRSIEGDAAKIGLTKENLLVVNYEQHKSLTMNAEIGRIKRLARKSDRRVLFVLDESHSPIGALKETGAHAQIKKWVKADADTLLLSATPTNETILQLYRQIELICRNTLTSYWSSLSKFKAEADIPSQQKWFGGKSVIIYDYKAAKLSALQRRAIQEHIVRMRKPDNALNSVTIQRVNVFCQKTDDALRRAMKQNYVKTKNSTLPLLNASSKLHALRMLAAGVYSSEMESDTEDMKFYRVWSCKFEFVYSCLKKYERVAVYYYYRAEAAALSKFFPKMLIAAYNKRSLREFNEGGRASIALQSKAGSEGIQLRNIDCMVVMTTDFSTSATMQCPSRGLSYTERLSDYECFFLVNTSVYGVDENVYKYVCEKQENYNVRQFRDVCEYA